MKTRAQPIRPKMRGKPRMPTPEETLKCANKRRLIRSLRQVEKKYVADWLLQSPHETFHHQRPIPHAAFDNALAMHASQATPPAGASSSGCNVLFVGVMVEQRRLLGYSFGGLSTSIDHGCPYGGWSCPVFPHFVGRFSYDIDSDEFLGVIHGVGNDIDGVVHIKNDGGSRERSLFVVKSGNYSKMLSLITGSEKRKSAIPRFQFSVNGRGATDALARMERLLKGEFACDKLRRDDLDIANGEVLNRCTMNSVAKFESMDAVGLQRAREHAVRIYYGYMSAISGASSSR